MTCPTTDQVVSDPSDATAGAQTIGTAAERIVIQPPIASRVVGCGSCIDTD